MLKRKNNANLAEGFSLVELSIVLVVLGLLVSGVFGAQALLSYSYVQSAKSASASAPMLKEEADQGPRVWFDAANEENFQKDSQNRVIAWMDKNPSTTKKDMSNLAYPDMTNAPVWVKNGLAKRYPAVLFSGQHLSSTNREIFRNVTAFVVCQLLQDTVGGGIISRRDGATHNMQLSYFDPATQFGAQIRLTSQAYYSNTTPPASGASAAKPIVLGFRYDSSSGSSNVKIYQNGDLTNTHDNSTPQSTISAGTFFLGTDLAGASVFRGYISEIILYDRVLADDEMASIHNYLLQKYKIK